MGKNSKGNSYIYLVDLFLKRAFDIVASFLGLVVLSPLFIVIGIIIKFESKGPIFFKQQRLGRKGKVFNIYKFRTMVVNAENIGKGIFVKEGDDRITKVGGILRITSLDELPQLINVIKGEMSVVGPRPPVIYHPHRYEDYSKEQKKRFSVRPGITGYAQVVGRNNLTWDERIKLDVVYVKNRTFCMDIKIIFATIITIFRKDFIYGDKGNKTVT